MTRETTRLLSEAEAREELDPEERRPGPRQGLRQIIAMDREVEGAVTALIRTVADTQTSFVNLLRKRS